MRILVYTPMLRLYGMALQSILRLEHPDRFDITFCKGGNIKNGDVKQTGFEIVTSKYNHARDIVLAGSYDAMLAVEDDMIVPSDALTRLLATGADIAYGLYCWRNQGWHKWSAYTAISDKHGVSLDEDKVAAKAAWGKVIDVAGIGMGCTLIHRHVLEALPFRTHEKACCDWALALDAQERGYSQKCDLGVVCGHMTTHNPSSIAGSIPWVLGATDQPRIIWPDLDAEGIGKLYRVEHLD